jgi:hypothetical protein
VIRVTFSCGLEPGTVSHVGTVLRLETSEVWLDGARVARRGAHVWQDEHGAYWTSLSVIALDAKEARWK